MTNAFPALVASLLAALLTLTALGCSRDADDSSTNHPQSRDSVHTNFSSEIVLDSYANAEVDGHSFLTLKWHAPYDRPRTSYSVFIHALDQKGNILFQFDRKLVNAAGLSTNLWDQEFVNDVFQITPPMGHSPGKYTLRIGVWVPDDDRWLKIHATNLVQDHHNFFKDKAVLLPGIDCH